MLVECNVIVSSVACVLRMHIHMIMINLFVLD